MMNEDFSGAHHGTPEAEIKFATVGNRFGAWMLDNLIISGIVLPVTYFNVIEWKVPFIFLLTSLIEILYKPFLEFRFGATLGKMAVGIQVLGSQFQKVNFNEEMKRVSFYFVPSFLQFLFIFRMYFLPDFLTFRNYNAFNQYLINSNPSLLIIGMLVSFLGLADCITYFANGQRRALHDFYAGTYVVQKLIN